MDKMANYRLSEIEDIVKNCEDIQNEGGPEYAKEQAKLTAYNEIRDILGFGQEVSE